MIKNAVICIFCICSVTINSAHSQTRKDSLPILPRYIIKFSAASLLDITPSIQFALEYKLKPYLTIQTEAGYINSIFNFFDFPQFKNIEGYRLRAETRLYAVDRIIYFAPELFLKTIWFDRTKVIGYDCEEFFRGEPECAYFENSTYKVIKNAYGGHLKLGIQSLATKMPIVLDFYTGIGIRYVDIRSEGKIIGANYIERRRISINHDDGYFKRLSLTGGIKIGYVIK